MKAIYLFILFSLLILSCEKGDEQVSRLNGSWVESEFRADTLLFGEFDPGDGQLWLELKRENMTGTGPYNYYFFHDSISLQWSLSSCLCRENYFFSLENNDRQFIIGNFIDPSDSSRKHLVFDRLAD